MNIAIGQTFGKLTVLSKMLKRDKSGHHYYLCQCECGEKTPVRDSRLISGNTRSCGCIRRENRSSYRARIKAENDFLAEERRKAQKKLEQ